MKLPHAVPLNKDIAIFDRIHKTTSELRREINLALYRLEVLKNCQLKL